MVFPLQRLRLLARASVLLPLGVACLQPSTADAQAVWRWVDKNGVVHYSDQPQPGATRVELLKSPGSRPTAATPAPAAPQPASSAPAASAAAAPAAEPPLTCAITAPLAEAVFVNVESVSITYSGPATGTARLLLNGQPVQRVASGTPFVVSPISRGTWSAVVSIEGAGASGKQSCQTAPLVFYVRQPSVLNQPASRPQPR